MKKRKSEIPWNGKYGRKEDDSEIKISERRDGKYVLVGRVCQNV